MKFEVGITPQAREDLDSIYRFVLEREGPFRADGMFRPLEQAILGLSVAPFRGKEPPELAALGRTDYLQIVVTPYRVLYGVAGAKVQVYLVVDGRRDFSGLLDRRLQRPTAEG